MPTARTTTVHRSRRRSLPYLLYLIPGAVSFAVIIAFPLTMNIWYSLHKWKGGMAPMRFIGLDNYKALLADEKFWASFGNSMYMIVAMVVIPTLIGLFLASVLFDYIGKHFNSSVATTLRAMYYLPRSCRSPWPGSCGTGSSTPRPGR